MRDPQPGDLVEHDPDAATVARLAARADEIRDAMLERTRRNVPGYDAGRPDDFLDAARAHCADHVRAFLIVARERRALTDGELGFVRDQAALRARQGVALEPLLHAYRQGHQAVVAAIVAAAGSTPAGLAAALRLIERTLDHVDRITTTYTEAYLRARHALDAGASAARRVLVEDVVAGTTGAEGPDRARALGIEWTTPHVVICVVGDVAALPVVADGLAALGMPVTVRHDEVVALTPVADGAATRVRERVGAVLIPGVRAGMGLPCDGLGAAPASYAEARTALRLADPGGMAALGDLTTGRYAALVADATAHRLIDPRVRAVLEADLADGGVLAATLEAYLDADMHAPAAAARLHVHPNTVYYRLDKLTGTTGTRSRRFHDLYELLTALRVIRVHRG